ncbi:TPA: RepB family plasmid replication initiator protein [Enterococcus faecium]
MNIIPRKVFTMNDIRNKKVVQHNDLIMSVAKMDKTSLKFFELAVAGLDTNEIPDDRTVYVSKDLLYSFFDVKSENKHTRFKEATLNVHKQAMFFMQEWNERKKSFEYQVISPLEKTSWNDYEDEISFKFTESIMPYLIELKENFTQYLLSDISKLNSKYSIILYKWLSMNFNQYEYYQSKGNRTEKRLEEYKNPIIKVDELRRITDTEKEYEKFFNFETRILKTAQKEITENTVFNISYEKIKKSRSIDSIQFFITKKVVAPIDYKEEQQDEIYLQSKEQKEREKQELFAKGMQSKYTTLLMEKMLLGYKDMQNVDTIADLQSRVYPLYDELKNMGGMNAVEEHISYIKNHEEPYSKTNISKYLYKCADGWVHVGAKRKYQ